MAKSAEQLAANLAEHRKYLERLQEQGALDFRNLEEATKKVQAMLQDAQQISSKVADRDLDFFLQQAHKSLRSLNDVATKAISGDTLASEIPEQVMARNTELAQGLEGLIKGLASTPEKAEMATNIINATEQTLETFGQITQKWGQMSTNEKITASVGMTATLVGVGLLVATAINPGLGLALLAGVLIGAGIWMCKKSIANHNDKKLNESLDTTHAAWNKIASNIETPKANSAMSFTKPASMTASSGDRDLELGADKTPPKHKPNDPHAR